MSNTTQRIPPDDMAWIEVRQLVCIALEHYLAGEDSAERAAVVARVVAEADMSAEELRAQLVELALWVGSYLTQAGHHEALHGYSCHSGGIRCGLYKCDCVGFKAGDNEAAVRRVIERIHDDLHDCAFLDLSDPPRLVEEEVAEPPHLA